MALCGDSAKNDSILWTYPRIINRLLFWYSRIQGLLAAHLKGNKEALYTFGGWWWVKEFCLRESSTIKKGLEKILSNGPLMICWMRWVNCCWSSRYGMVKQNGKIQITWEKRKSLSRKKNKEQYLFVDLFTMSRSK